MTTARSGSLSATIPAFFGVIAGLVFAALSLSTNSATRFYQWPWFFYWQVLLVAPIAILAGRLLWRGHLVRFGGWLDAGLILLAAANLAAALLSPFRPQSLNLALIPVAGISLAYLGLDWIECDLPERAGRTAIAAGTIGSLMLLFIAVSYGLWLFADVLPGWIAGGSLLTAARIRNTEPFGHSLYTAGAAVLSAPWLAALGLTGSRRMRGLWLSGAALALALVPTTASRGGALAVIAMLGCAAAAWFLHPSTTRRHRLVATTGTLLLAVIIVGLDPRLRDLALRGRWSSAATESNQQHSAMLQAGWLMGWARPSTGYGPGSVPRVYPHYRAQLNGGTDNVLQLHNVPAQFWAELGAPGVAALLFLLIGVVDCGRTALQASGVSARRKAGITPASGDSSPAATGEPATRLRAQAVLIAFAGCAVMSLFDFELDVPWFVATVAALLVLLKACSADSAPAAVVPVVAGQAARCTGLLLLAGFAAMLWPTLIELRARQSFAKATDARQAGDDVTFVMEAERAAAIAPREPFYLTQLALFYGDQSLGARDTTERARARDRCCACLGRALAIDPDQDYCHFNLGWLLLADQSAEAEEHFCASARLSPYRGGVYLGVGLSLLDRNEPAAVTAFALEWLNDPQSLASPLWDVPPLATLRPKIALALHRLADHWLEQEALLESDRDRIRYVAALADWWLGRSADTTTLIRCGSPAQRLFFQNLDAIERRSYTPSNPGLPAPWESLYLAWRTPTVPSALDADQPAFATALRRRIGESPDSFAQLITGPTAADAALVRFEQNERPGYSVVVRNQDGFPVHDLYIFPENVLVEKHLSFLFPPKGCLPDRLLLAALRDLPAAPR
jgi:hypothetical protein